MRVLTVVPRRQGRNRIQRPTRLSLQLLRSTKPTQYLLQPELECLQSVDFRISIRQILNFSGLCILLLRRKVSY